MVINLRPSKDYLRCVWVIHLIALYALWTSAFSWGIICAFTALVLGSFAWCRQQAWVDNKLFWIHKEMRMILDAGLWWIVEKPGLKKKIVVFKDQIPSEQRHAWCLLLRNHL